ncbi:MAG TPA: hypothetical protein DCM40_02610 [Maribacter sp.]|nr:hypothetical protein [Maribacter sp.]
MQGIFTNPHEAIAHITESLNCARKEKSNLSDGSDMSKFILNMFGMSGKKWRHFLNNLAGIENVRYAEVGAHTGSTLCSALYKNKDIKHISTLDNWSQFADEKTREVLIQNVSATANMSGFSQEDLERIKMFEGDFNTFDYTEISPIDIYFFDGPHDEESQYQGIVKAFDSFADTSIILVDDWNWGGPKKGTLRALKDLSLDVNYQCEIFTYPETYDSKTGALNRFQFSDWHNGVSIFVVTKN